MHLLHVKWKLIMLPDVCLNELRNLVVRRRFIKQIPSLVCQTHKAGVRIFIKVGFTCRGWDICIITSRSFLPRWIFKRAHVGGVSGSTWDGRGFNLHFYLVYKWVRLWPPDSQANSSWCWDCQKLTWASRTNLSWGWRTQGIQSYSTSNLSCVSLGHTVDNESLTSFPLCVLGITIVRV